MACGWHATKSCSGLGPVGAPKSGISLDAGARRVKSANGMRAGGLLNKAGETEIAGCISRHISVTSPLLGHLGTKHPLPPPPFSCLDTHGSSSIDLLHLQAREPLASSYSHLALFVAVAGLLHLQPGIDWRYLLLL
jgi:hypothetical protein